MLKNITMDKTRFRLDLKLQNLSMISIATKLWDSPDIKNRIENNFSGLDREYPDENWRGISKLVVEYANSIYLPASLSLLLKKTIVLIGQKIYDWIYYVNKILGLDLITTQKIYFTFGAIDEVKIFDFYWRDLMAPDDFIYESDYFKHSPLFSLACMYGCEGFVKERKNEMLDELSKLYPKIKAGDEIYNIMSVSICMTKTHKIPENVPLPLQMFEVCLKAGFSKAARFYWEKLDEIEKVSNLTNFAKKCWRKDDNGSFLMEKNCENLLFLINEMGEEERYSFLTDYADEIIKLFLPVWPYRELIVDLLKYDWNVESSRLGKMVDALISFNFSMNRLEFPLDNELLFEIMQKAWGNISVDEKLFCLNYTSAVVSNLFSTLNLEILNLVLNDPSVREVDLKKIDDFRKRGFLELVKMGKFDFLDELIESGFNFIPGPEELLNDQYSVRGLIDKDESFGLMDQFLDWSAESETERARLKNKINTLSVCKYLTEHQYVPFKFELAEKFLKWRLETDAEIKRFKEEMKSYNFVIVLFFVYIRIKSGDLNWLSREDSLALHPEDDKCDNADGLTFLKFEDATEFNRGVALGIKSFSFEEDYDFLGPGCCRAVPYSVQFVGTEVGDYIVFIVCNIWNNVFERDFDLDHVVCLSNAVIKFYYETDEEVLKFKNTKLLALVTEKVSDFLADAFFIYLRFPKNFLNDFCKFCMIPSEEIEEVKMLQRRDIENFLDTYLIDQCMLEMAHIYLRWLFGEVQKAEECKTFLNSSNKGALLCVSFFREWRVVDRPSSWRYNEMCRWLSIVDDMEKLKNDVLALFENTPEWFSDLLDMSAHSDVSSIWRAEETELEYLINPFSAAYEEPDEHDEWEEQDEQDECDEHDDWDEWVNE